MICSTCMSAPVLGPARRGLYSGGNLLLTLPTAYTELWPHFWASKLGGGKVFIRDLDASTITAGTLNADVITLREAFSVQSRDLLGNWQDCGHIGGYARLNGNNEIELTSSNGKCRLGVEDGAVYLEAVDPSNAAKVTSVDVLPDYVEIMARDGTDRVWLEVTPRAINFKKSGGAWHDLFDLI